jgi:short-subunit dehydrogenase
MQEPPPGVVLITGASSGIGYELSQFFARDGNNLVLVARREKKLDGIARDIRKKYSVQVKIIAKDLSVPQSPDEIYTELKQAGLTVDVLVNNAGFGNYGFFVRNNIHRELESIRLNVSALVHLTSLFATGMVERKKGKILNIASTAAFGPGPLMATYFASKAYVLSFSQALANELQGTNVSVTCLCPGPTETEFNKTAGMPALKISRSRMSAKKVAQIAYRGLMKKKAVVVPGISNNIMVIASKCLGRSVTASILRKVYETAGKNKSR